MCRSSSNQSEPCGLAQHEIAWLLGIVKSRNDGAGMNHATCLGPIRVLKEHSFLFQTF
jgi:hypothetical protein